MAIVTHVDHLRYRRTKIVATIGPASESKEAIRQLIEAGVNVFRLNMSHGDHSTHRQVFQHIRDEADASGQPVAVLADLCGPKIRTGRFPAGPIRLIPGETVMVTTRDVPGENGIIPSQYEDLHKDVAAGDRILIADGLLELRVIGIQGQDIECQVVHGGMLSDHKGINLPGVNVSTPSLTDKDKVDARFALELGVDFIAMSFVRSADDMALLRDLISEVKGEEAKGHEVKANEVKGSEAKDPPSLIAKIEKPEALQNADAIINASDGIMVARGDLGVELAPEEVPLAQDELIALARRNNKPVIVATQMLESMITSARPTRAEVTDVAYAVSSGTDAVMLSGETAVGDHPIQTAATMDRIARQVEAHLNRQGMWGHIVEHQVAGVLATVIADATSHMSKALSARGIVVISQSGISAVTVSNARPAAPIVAITSSARVFRRMALMWGVIPVIQSAAGVENPNELARQVADELSLATSGEVVLLVRGFHEDPSLNLPSVTVITI